MKRKATVILLSISIMIVVLNAIAIGAVAESTPADSEVQSNLSEDTPSETSGMETVTPDNSLSLTFNTNSFSVNINPDNSVIAEYLGDIKAGFSIYRCEGIDAESYMMDAAKEYDADLEYAPCFGEEREWYFFASTGEEDGVESIDIEYARSNSDGVWFVSTYAFLSGDEAADMNFSDEMSIVLNSMTFAD